MAALVVGRGQGAETLLSARVPDLKEVKKGERRGRGRIQYGGKEQDSKEEARGNRRMQGKEAGGERKIESKR